VEEHDRPRNLAAAEDDLVLGDRLAEGLGAAGARRGGVEGGRRGGAPLAFLAGKALPPA
jgi:hypothetical protein